MYFSGIKENGQSSFPRGKSENLPCIFEAPAQEPPTHPRGLTLGRLANSKFQRPAGETLTGNTHPAGEKPKTSGGDYLLSPIRERLAWYLKVNSALIVELSRGSHIDVPERDLPLPLICNHDHGLADNRIVLYFLDALVAED